MGIVRLRKLLAFKKLRSLKNLAGFYFNFQQTLDFFLPFSKSFWTFFSFIIQKERHCFALNQSQLTKARLRMSCLNKKEMFCQRYLMLALTFSIKTPEPDSIDRKNVSRCYFCLWSTKKRYEWSIQKTNSEAFVPNPKMIFMIPSKLIFRFRSEIPFRSIFSPFLLAYI